MIAITDDELDELLATKLRALYQRSKGRDLFDLAVALNHPAADPARIVKAFSEYMSGGAAAEAQADRGCGASTAGRSQAVERALVDGFRRRSASGARRRRKKARAR